MARFARAPHYYYITILHSACSIPCLVFIPHERYEYRSVIPLGVTKVNRTIFKDDVVHNHSAHGYYITRMEGGVRYAWYCCYMLNRRTSL